MKFDLEKIMKDVKNSLSEKRYIHSVGVMKQAEYLAEKYGQDIEVAKTVGIAHDIAKEMSQEEKLNYVKENNIEIDEIEKINVGLLHAKIGADICKKKYNFNEDMQNAIKYHTTGNEKMDTLAKIIFVADKTEENRKYEDLETVKKLADESLDKCMLYILNYMLVDNVKKEKLIHPDSINLRNKIMIEK
jgi:predicted HD superfamily hydrolase involved in NAD metabolism